MKIQVCYVHDVCFARLDQDNTWVASGKGKAEAIGNLMLLLAEESPVSLEHAPAFPKERFVQIFESRSPRWPSQ